MEQVGDQFREPLDLSLCSAILNSEVLALHTAKVVEPVPEGLEIAFGLRGVPAGPEHADTAHLPRRLRHGEERRREQTQGERDDASEGAAPHGRLLTSASCRPSSYHGSRTLCFRRGEQPQRRRSVGCSPSPASGGSARMPLTQPYICPC